MGQLQKNLRALASRDASLVKRLGLPVASAQVRGLKSAGRKGELRLERLERRRWLPLALDESARAELLAWAASRTSCALFGLGDGAQVLALLQTGAPEVTAWDRDPWLMRLFLDRHDVSAHLASGRLRLLLASDLIGWLESQAAPRELWPHPAARLQYASEWQLCGEAAIAQSQARRGFALVVTGELFVDDLEDALRAEGFRVYPLDASLHALEELTWQILRLQPALVAAINYKNGLAELCEKLQTQLISWEIDPTTDKLAPLSSPAPRARVYTYRRAQVPEFREAGFSRAEYLPLAANPKRRRPPDPKLAGQYAVPISFVGASLQGPIAAHKQSLHALLRQAEPSLSRGAFEARLRELLDEQARDDLRYSVPAIFARLFPLAQRSRIGRDPVQLAAEIAAAETRARLLSALGPLGVHVWGDEGFRALTASGAAYRGPAGHLEELNQIYGHSAINVDLGRIYQSDIVTMRVFDAMACGGFVLAERSDALAELFELEREVATYGSQAELVERARYFLGAPDEARAIAERGRARVLRDHTIQQRVRTMLA